MEVWKGEGDMKKAKAWAAKWPSGGGDMKDRLPD